MQCNYAYSVSGAVPEKVISVDLNPASNSLKIDSEKPVQKIQIDDLRGKLIK